LTIACQIYYHMSSPMKNPRFQIALFILLGLAVVLGWGGVCHGRKSSSGSSAEAEPTLASPLSRHAANPVLQPAEWCAWDCTAFGPIAVLADAPYKMWYLGAGPGNTGLGYATSNDGISWTKNSEPLAFLSAYDLAVVKDSLTYKMWYTNDNGVYYTTSAGGLSWAAPILVASEVRDRFALLYDGAVYHIWYDKSDAVNVVPPIYYATSNDGQAWVAQNSASPVLTDTRIAGNVILDNGQYLMWVTQVSLSADRLISSTDGINWFTSDSWRDSWQESCVIKDGAAYKSWYITGTSTALVDYASSTDGITWTAYSSNPVITSTASANPESHGLWPGSVVKDVSTYRMWYGYAGHDGVEHFGYATSTDGASWSRLPGGSVMSPTAGAWDEAIAQPEVIKDGLTYKMWYYGTSITATGIGYATSVSGTGWTKYGAGPVLAQGATETIYGFSVYKGGDGTYNMWYHQTDNNTGRVGFRYAYSTDGINWTRDSNWVLEPAASWDTYMYRPVVIADNAGYRMWYGSYNDQKGYRINEASSPDWFNWTKLGMALEKGSSGEWDSYMVEPVCGLKDGLVYRLYYTGTDAKGYRRVGIATR